MHATSPRGPQKYVADVGAMNARVTTDTRLALGRLGVLGHRRQARPGVRRGQMALQADLVHIGMNQQLVVRSTVREVAETTACSFDRRVFIDEGAGRRRVAFGAHYELPSGRRLRILSRCAVRIVAVGAIDQPLFNLVMNGHGELRLDVVVALNAKLGLLHLEQVLRRAGCMDGVAADAAYITPAVGRMLKVYVRSAMACLAFFIDLFGRGCRGVEDQCDIAALCMLLAGAVTALAGHAFAAVARRRLAVRFVGETLHDLFVTGRAGCGFYKVARVRLHRLVAVGLGFAWLSRHCGCAKDRRAQH